MLFGWVDQFVLISGKKISTVGQIVPILERVLDAGEKSLFVLGDGKDPVTESDLLFSSSGRVWKYAFNNDVPPIHPQHQTNTGDVLCVCLQGRR